MNVIQQKIKSEKTSFIELQTALVGVIFGILLLKDSLYVYVSQFQFVVFAHLLMSHVIGLLCISFFTAKLLFWSRNILEARKIMSLCSTMFWVWITAMFFMDFSLSARWLFTLAFALADCWSHMVLSCGFFSKTKKNRKP